MSIRILSNQNFWSLFLYFITLPMSTYARTHPTRHKEYIPEGNFALPPAVQPFPLISFGQNLIGSNILQPEVEFESIFATQKTYSTTFTPQVLWGISDNFSLFVTLPVSPKNRSGNQYSSGLGDMAIQAEADLFNIGNDFYSLQSTFVANVTAPTGSANKIPQTGNGNATFFIGPTLAYMDSHWYTFTSYGATFPLKYDNFQSGINFLYQAGVARNIPTSNKTILLWMVEFDGTYTWKDRFNGIKDPNSGSNILYITPSLYLSTIDWIFQVGVGYPAIQLLNGDQAKEFLTVTAAVTYTLYYEKNRST